MMRGNKLFVCPITPCKSTFTQKHSLTYHIDNWHAAPKREKCGKSLRNKSTLTQHMKAHDDPGWKSVKSKENLKQKEKRGALKFECELCGKYLSSKSNKVAHIRYTHLKEFGNKCSYPNCGRELSSLKNLKMHESRHLSPEEREKYSCHECEKVFLNLQSLKMHSKLHSGQVLKCIETGCDKVFVRKSEFKRHFITHDKNRIPESCPHCDKTYTSKSNLKTHIRDKHNKENLRVHNCPLCSKVFKSKGNMRMHELSHDENRVKHRCPKCSSQFANIYSLRRHVEKKHATESRPTFKCAFPSCGKEFPLRELTSHVSRVHGERRFKCYFCHKSFRTSNGIINHVRSHTEERPYVCVNCGKCFGVVSTLNCHMKTHDPVLRLTHALTAQ